MITLELRTLRVRAVFVSVLIALSPLIFVWLGPSVEESTLGTMQGGLYETAQHAVRIIEDNDGVATDGWARHRLDELAAQDDVWLRVVTPGGRVLQGANHGSDTSVSASFLEKLLTHDPGRPSSPNTRRAGRSSPSARSSPARSQRGRAALCEYALQGRLLTCVEVHRGRIHVDSKLGDGTQFVVRL